ncbi:hypothetical protein A500_10550 [Clostridium sartagoforme AAU1]|uniref:Uncharacterized protein n=1 Tax=Clostridium sartagoforme AAU1 TaxID=1202534 RepID=R9C8K2_9CLOT|nr:hypothetical protein [Clostridium sartagoforme]EOR25310.1 hypothetical protein A500_10550 [Clostridium sartagoforme AAU1]
MYDLKEISYMTANALINELYKKGMLQLQPTAFERTKNDVKGFKIGLKMLSDEQVPTEFKKQLAVQMMDIQSSIKWLKDQVHEQDYIIFCQHNMQNESIRSIAANYGIDEGTVKRALTRCIHKLSIFLHPDVSLSEIFY